MIVPPVSRAHARWLATPMLVAVVILDTSTGVELKTPLPTILQHFTAPPVSRAHERLPPTPMLVAVVIPDTSTGVVLSVVVPSPSWP